MSAPINEIVLPLIDDLHMHGRRGSVLQAVMPHTARYARRAIMMPNTQPAILKGADVVSYNSEIRRALEGKPGGKTFTPLMVVEIRATTTPEIIRESYNAGAVAGKVYPKGGTTNSSDGFTLEDFESGRAHEVFREMKRCGMLLLIHGETPPGIPGDYVMRREADFLKTMEKLVRLPDMPKVVLEHVSDYRSVEFVGSAPDTVAATITAHHLMITTNDVLGDGIRPHNMCMPVPKTPKDMEMLRHAATSGLRDFFAGSDSAPHVVGNKECAKGACGAFTAPHLVELYATVFDEMGKLNHLKGFLCEHGADFYGMKRSGDIDDRTIRLVRQDHVINELEPAVPDVAPLAVRGGGEDRSLYIVPFMAGETLPWKLVD